MKCRISIFCLIIGTICTSALAEGNTSTNGVSTQAVLSATSTQTVASATSTQKVVSATSTQTVNSATSTQAVTSATSTQTVASVTSTDTVPVKFTSSSFDEKKHAIAAAIQFFIPATSDAWKNGMGSEIQYRSWINNKRGWIFAVGYQNWLMTDTMPVTVDSYFNPEVESSTVSLLPLGVSLFYKIPRRIDSRLSIILDGGIRYVFVQSNAEVTFDYVNHYGDLWHISSPITVDDRIMAVANITAGMNISEKFSWFI
jgi:hypothetical protein